MMRNTTFRRIIEETTTRVNEGIQQGIEPLAIAMAFRQLADQCDKLAEQFEKQEAEQKEKGENDGRLETQADQS